MKRIRLLLQQANMSQSELSRRSGVNHAIVNAVVNGRLAPYPSQLSRLAEALGWREDPAALLDEVDDAPQSPE